MSNNFMFNEIFQNKNLNKPSPEPNNIKENIGSILLYSLSLATALGFNDLILTIFGSFKYTGHIIAKTTYVVIIFGMTILFAYYLKSSVAS
jgi:hypothetical protein